MNLAQAIFNTFAFCTFVIAILIIDPTVTMLRACLAAGLFGAACAWIDAAAELKRETVRRRQKEAEL